MTAAASVVIPDQPLFWNLTFSLEKVQKNDGLQVDNIVGWHESGN